MHHGSINGTPLLIHNSCEFVIFSGDYDQQMKQSPNHQQPPPQSQQSLAPPPPDVTNFNYSEDPSNDTNAILKLKESMQEEVKKFDKTPNNSNNDDYSHFGSIG